jgi:type VI secretion system secreted protein Hcp
MAVDAFLKIDGVESDSSDQKHKNEIEILSYSWGVDQTGSHAAGGGGGAGKATFQDLHFVANTNKASPTLFLACASGQHFKSAILTVRKAGKEQQEFLKVSVEDVLVTEFNNAGEASEVTVPTDQFSIAFLKIDFSVRPQNEDGSIGQAEHAGWDLNRNVKL